MKIDIYNDNIGYVTDEVSTVKSYEANKNEENRVKFITDLAAVSRGKTESNNPKVRYKKLLKEAALETPSRPLEFLPIVFDLVIGSMNNILLYALSESVLDGKHFHSFDDFTKLQKLLKYSYIERSVKDLGGNVIFRIYSNMRACINAGIPYNTVPYGDEKEYQQFKAIKANIPMFVWAQVPNTHTAISKESQSDRVTENNNYWLPEDFMDRIKGKIKSNEKINMMLLNILSEISYIKDRELLIEHLLSMPQETIKVLFKRLGYKREIYSRSLYYFKYKEVVMTGWNNNPDVWEHLFLERGATDKWKNWTQPETIKFVKSIKSVI